MTDVCTDVLSRLPFYGAGCHFLPHGLCAHRRTGSPGSWLPRRRDRADLVDPGRVNIFERWESQAALQTFRSSGPDTEQHLAMLTVSVQEYDIADAGVFGEGAE